MSVVAIIRLGLVWVLAMLTQQAAQTRFALACSTRTAAVADATRTVVILVAPLPSQANATKYALILAIYYGIMVGNTRSTGRRGWYRCRVTVRRASMPTAVPVAPARDTETWPVIITAVVPTPYICNRQRAFVAAAAMLAHV